MKNIPDESNELRQPQQAESRTDSLGEKLKVMIGNLPPGEVTMAEIRDLVGQEGLLLLTVFLTIVFMVPVSIPGVSTVFGTAILLISISRLLGRNLWLPKRTERRVLPTEKLRAGLNRGSIWLQRLERVSRPHRLSWLASPGLMDILTNCAMIVGSLLLMAPFGLIPFSNTLPALALLFFAVGLLQRDGLCILFGHLANLATIIYFIFLLSVGGAAIREMFRYVLGKVS
jgi:hypothetical protein